MIGHTFQIGTAASKEKWKIPAKDTDYDFNPALDGDVISTMNQLEARLEDVKTPLNVAVIGCVVNGPGEAKEADLGFTGGNPESLALFIDGKPAARLPGSDFLDELESMIRKQAEIKEHARVDLIVHSTDRH